MANCCSDASEPRIWRGATSAMYAGATTEAMPMPRPLITRQRIRSGTLKVRAAPIDDTKNSTAPSSMTFNRPQRSERAPAMMAPTAQPSRATATTKPVSTCPSSKLPSTASTAPLMTEESKPKRKPPTAAATERPMARRP